MALALALGAFVGAVMGLVGSGGFLAVPALVYGLGLSPDVAPTSALLAVGLAALAGALSHAWAGSVDLRAALIFGVPGMIASAGAARAAERLPGSLRLAVFALVALYVARLMLRATPAPAAPGGELAPGGGGASRIPPPRYRAALTGLGAGAIAGFAGVGGGFAVVPALTLVLGVPIHRAVGTSLLVVAANTLTGWASSRAVAAEGHLVHAFAGAACVASLGVSRLSSRVPAARLKRGFGIFLVVVALGMLAREGARLAGARTGGPSPGDRGGVSPAASSTPAGVASGARGE